MSRENAKVDVLMNPFPGLRPFREEEEYLFFGREHQVDAMVDKLAATRFLAVVGTSGSGKSSLVNCGLRPALRRGLMAPAGTAWRMAQFRPGNKPIQALARALAQEGVLFSGYETGSLSLPDIIETTLRMSQLGLIDIYEQARLASHVNLLVVVDQFEELFRYQPLRASPNHGENGHVPSISEEAMAFVNLLLAPIQQATCPIYVVLTMRSDFLGNCAKFPGLAEAINAGQYLVPRMTRDERRAAISGPVRVGGAEIAPVLLTRLVNDVGDNPDQLSILQHALNRTWARWYQESATGPLELTHYEAIGTMAHALDRHAERAFTELTHTRERKICEKLFKALTDKATDPRGIRRPTKLSTLCALCHATEAEVTKVIDVFRKPSRSFLMPQAGEALDAETVIDISHESLMRVWHRLKVWADEEAASADQYRRLSEAAALHQQEKASLWRNPQLRLGVQWREKERPTSAWAQHYGGSLDQALAFLDQSVRAQRMRSGLLVLGVLIVMVFLAWWGWSQQVIAEAQRDIAKKSDELAKEQQAFAKQQQARAAELENELNTFLQKNPLLKKEVVSLRQTNRELTLRVLEIEYENRDLNWQQGRLTIIQDNRKAERHSLKNTIDDLHDEINKLKITIADLEGEIPKLQNNVQSLMEDRTKEQEIEKKTQDERSHAIQKLYELRQKNKELRDQAYSLGILIEQRIEETPDDLRMVEPVLESQELEIGETPSESFSPDIAEPATQMDLPSQSTSPEDRYDELQFLRDENLRLALTANELREANSVLQTKIEGLETRRIELQSIVEKLRDQNKGLQNEIAQLSKQVDQLAQNRDELRKERSRLAQESKKLEREIKNLEHQIQAVRHRMKEVKIHTQLIKNVSSQIHDENTTLLQLIQTPPIELKQRILEHWESR